MNILIFSWRGPRHPNAGGAEISTHEHAKGWVRGGFSVTLFTSYYPGAKRDEVIDGIRVIRRGKQVFGVQWEAFKWYIFESHSKFDLVVDQFHGIPFFTPLFVKIKKLAFIHEVTKEVWWMNPWPKPFNLIPSIIGSAFEPLVFKIFYHNIPFMTVSQSTKDDLIKWGIPKVKVTVVHNGINVAKLVKLPPKEKKKTAIFLGALSKDKGIENALKIFSLISRKENDWQFWVVGKSDSKYLSYLKNLAKNLGILNKITFFGFVTESKKFELLAKAHILVNPSIREGWGLVVIEAASVGTPTIAFNVPGLRDSVKNHDTGLLCEGSVKEFADLVVELLNDQKKYQRMCKDAISWSRSFSWDKATKKSLGLIKTVATD